MVDEKEKGNENNEEEGKEQNNDISKKFDDMVENLKGLKDSGEATNTKIESLLNEALEKGKEDVEEEYSEDDLQQMTPSQVVQLITDSVNKSMGGKIQQLETAIMTLKIGDEIKECRGKYDDFDSLKEDIQKKALSNPHLSIEDSYKLVKADKGESVLKKKGKPPEEKKEDEKGEEGKKKLIKTFFGEKPDITPGATKDKGPESIREAANKAFDDLNTE